MNEDERGITPAEVTSMTLERLGEPPASPFDQEWRVTIERGNGDEVKLAGLTEMERVQLGLMLDFEPGGTPVAEHVSFVDFARRALR